MRIFSTFKDYYDGALKDFQLDAFPVYNRTTESIDISHKINFINMPLTVNYHDKTDQIVASGWYYYEPHSKKLPYNELIELKLKIIGFCGKIYPVYTNNDNSIIKYANDYPSISTFKSYNFRTNNFNYESTIDGWNELINSQILIDLFLKYKTPVYILEPFKTLKTNNLLSEYKFQRIFNPYEAIQEIDMYLNNVLVEDKQPIMPVGSDKIIAESKGFDKHSFRKGKEI